MSHLKITSTPHAEQHDVMMVSLAGHMDESNLAQFKEVLHQHTRDGHIAKVILDMQDVEFLNSRVLGFLISFYSEGAQHKTRLVLFRPSMPIGLVLQRVGVDKLYPIATKLDQALEA